MIHNFLISEQKSGNQSASDNNNRHTEGLEMQIRRVVVVAAVL